MNSKPPTRSKYKSHIKSRSPLRNPTHLPNVSKKNPWRKRILLSKTKKTSFLDRLESGLPQKKVSSLSKEIKVSKVSPQMAKVFDFVQDFKQVKNLLQYSVKIDKTSLLLTSEKREGKYCIIVYFNSYCVLLLFECRYR